MANQPAAASQWWMGNVVARGVVAGVVQPTCRDFEFGIVNDASTDSTPQTLGVYAAADSRLVLANNPANIGMAASLNKAISLARGRYVARHDADDLSAPTRLQEQVMYLEQHPEVGLLSSLIQIIDEAGQPLSADPYAGGFDNTALQVDLLSRRLDDRRISLEVTAAAREGLAITGFDPAYGARPLRRPVQRGIGHRLGRAPTDG